MLCLCCWIYSSVSGNLRIEIKTIPTEDLCAANVFHLHIFHTWNKISEGKSLAALHECHQGGKQPWLKIPSCDPPHHTHTHSWHVIGYALTQHLMLAGEAESLTSFASTLHPLRSSSRRDQSVKQIAVQNHFDEKIIRVPWERLGGGFFFFFSRNREREKSCCVSEKEKFKQLSDAGIRSAGKKK